MDDLKSITDRIKKLLALSQSSNEHEAANAATAAARLQTQYCIDQAMLEDDGQVYDLEDIVDLEMDVGSRHKGSWKSAIRRAVVDLNACKTYLMPSGVHLFGRKSAVQTVIYTCQYLYSEIVDIANKEWAKVKLRNESKYNWTNAFCYGCALRVAERIREQIPKRLEGIPERALAIIIKHDQEVTDAFSNLSEQLGLKVVKNKKKYVSKAAYNEGRTMGNSINIGNKRPALGAIKNQIRGAK
jgi:hypothetical protein